LLLAEPVRVGQGDADLAASLAALAAPRHELT
jgi:hypothetical protein